MTTTASWFLLRKVLGPIPHALLGFKHNFMRPLHLAQEEAL